MSAFDRSAFGRLAEVGSLFVQHVKQDGRIIRDDGSQLCQTLAAFSPKPDYLGERDDALRQIAALPCENGSYWHDLCLADIVYVLFRNAAILHLASSGHYCFSYEELVLRSVDILQLGSGAQEALTSLRILKHAYRSRHMSVEVAGQVDQARDIAAEIGRRVGGLHASAVAMGATTDDYLHLRLRELELASTITPPVLDQLPLDHPLYSTWRSMICTAGYPKNQVSRLH
ncbi:hypothetical protein NKW45_01050 [Acetobacter orientalis]|uniref:hypothetical protein n=1 Tax=Acetobacter orientalis TaxID=146474 RepID=UPI0020A61C1B|nr:hypothetical protein [Acetobacter orientalis]MCP1220430.1 hypothetical protein [Acetobacter orientalis]